MQFIDTHIHIDGNEFDTDRNEVVARAKSAGAVAMLDPAIDLPTTNAVLEVSSQFPGFIFPMAGLHPEEVKTDYEQQLRQIRKIIDSRPSSFIAIGEVGLDYYWSRDYEKEQQRAFDLQVQWSIQTRLPLMIHCRKAQNEMLAILRPYAKELPGGVFHCFSGNVHEAAQLLDFDNFFLGIGGVLTFKKSRLPLTLADIPLERMVLETDAPYMAPVPMRGKRNESAFIPYIIERLAQCRQCSADEVAATTTRNAKSIFKRISIP